MFDYKPAGRMPFAVRMADIKQGDHVLEVGCFNGQLERHFLKGKCAAYYGVDVNEQAIAFARNASPADRFQIALAEKLPFADSSFDKVFCLDTLEHVFDEKAAVSEIYRILKPGGSLILSVPHDFLNFLDPDELTRDLRNFVRKYIKKRELLNHPKHRHYSENELRSLLSAFAITKVHKSGTPVFWTLTMFYTALGLPEKFTIPLRTLTNPIEDWEYALKLPTGFNIMVKALK